MPYRHRPDKNALHKVISLLLAELPPQDRDYFARVRQCMMDAANQMAKSAFVADPLFEDGSGGGRGQGHAAGAKRHQDAQFLLH